jgi:murein DD-endopeptidase MepM/ murein hydrolase activator NlpD
MKNPFYKIKNLSKKQAMVLTFAWTFSIFAMTTLLPAFGQSPMSEPIPVAEEVQTDVGEEVQTVLSAPATPTYAPAGSLGTVEARGILIAPAEVKFVNLNDRNINYYHWNFGDQYSASGHNTASGALPRAYHTYSKAGTFTASVKGYVSYEAFQVKQVAETLNLTIKIREQQVSSTGWIWPAEGRVQSTWGMRTQPVTGEYRMHQGIDIKNVKGTTIVASRSGKVVATWSGCRATATNCAGGYGNYVVIHHSNGLYSIYAHLSQVNTGVGNWVRAGQKIGEMGSTGLTPDVHLHFGIGPTLWVNQNTKNPLNLLPKR